MADKGDPAAKRAGATAPKPKTMARLAAVQALYQLELSGSAPDSVKQEFLDHRLGEELDGLHLGHIDGRLFGVLVDGIAAESAELDDMLMALLPEDWPVQRLTRLLRIILRAGAFELAARPDTPARVIITEYVDLAHAFFEGKEPGMANAILDRMARFLRPEEFSDGGAADAVPDLG
jgi:N utilization substance protein B